MEYARCGMGVNSAREGRGPVVLLVVAIHTKLLFRGAVDPFYLTVG